ncbi:MAG: GntP family permease [Eubacterium sp.]|nr:GntP family permease [Eubacterium sp.]
MFTSVGVSAAFLIAGLIIFIVMCFKGFHTAFAAFAGAVVVAFGATDGWASAVLTSFPTGVGTFVINNAMIFFSSGVFAFVMRETRTGEAMANTIVDKMGVKYAPYAIFIVSALLQLAGISMYQFIVAPIVFSMMKSANLPLNIGYAAAIAAPPIISFTLPGVTALPNVLPTTYLGTTLYAAPAMSLVIAIVGIVLCIIYLQYIINRARVKGIGYSENSEGSTEVQCADLSGGQFGEIEIPSFKKSLIPVVMILVLAFAFQIGLGWEAMPTVCAAMWITSAVVLLINIDTAKKISLKTILSRGWMDLCPFMVMAACVYGFGTVTQASACFEPLQNMFLSLDMNPYFTAWLSIALIAGLCADGIGGMIMWLSVFGSTYVAMPNVNAGALHRIIVSTATTFDSLPHSSAVATGIAVFRTNYKESYIHSFILTVCIPVIFSLLAVGIAVLFY